MISILMPLYNGIEFLRQSASSVKRQTYKEWELLIGVNGLSDEEVRRVHFEIRGMKDNRMIISQPLEKGKVKTLNHLSGAAKYDRICLLDVDDYWHAKKLEKQLPLINKYDVIGTDAQYFGSRRGSPGLFLGKLSTDMFSFRNPIINSSVMLNKTDAKWKEEWEGLDDYNLWWFLLNLGRTFYNLPEAMVRHRLHNKSAYNHINSEMSSQLQDKMPKLNEEQRLELESIMNEKKWQL